MSRCGSTTIAVPLRFIANEIRRVSQAAEVILFQKHWALASLAGSGSVLTLRAAFVSRVQIRKSRTTVSRGLRHTGSLWRTIYRAGGYFSARFRNARLKSGAARSSVRHVKGSRKVRRAIKCWDLRRTTLARR